MSDNPYRFTVVVEFAKCDGCWDVMIEPANEGIDDYMLVGTFRTEAEANEHAELIRQAMREVSA
jgi:hypothetical protein